VDVKTVERWIIKGRLPYRAHRTATATLLRTTEAYLWPDVLDDPRTTSASRAELVMLYPHRGAVQKDLWMQLIEAAEDHIDVLVYAGLFLPDGYPELAKVLIAKAEQGTAIRLALGDPDSEAVRQRGEEEHIGEGMAARVRLSLAYLDEAIGCHGVELRLHTTTLYNSIYRFGSDMLVNAHAYGSRRRSRPSCTCGTWPAAGCSTTTWRHSSGYGSRAARRSRSPEGGAPMARVDYYNDPDAPKANSLVPSVTAIVSNQDGAILMVHKTDNDLWALPGGGMDVGESMADAVVREVKEETGIDVEVTGVVGIYTNPNHVMAYDDGEVRQQCSICFTTRLLGGTLATSSETKEVRFVASADLAALNIHPSMRLRINHYLDQRSEPYIG
jgi:ADP-ribose pyrophosphatase YjhB (NUDIX family)